ncbi:MAG: hypothetical protein HQL79_01220 [Magnetococcales bacterium]|nr:hypothetical protein [Magnetococcales bacterium]
MPIYLNTNLASMNAQRNMLKSSGELGKVFARLSSGVRINTAGDDAAGLAISNRMTSQIRGLSQAVRNANDGISVSQVAEGALQEHADMLQRINELSVQAANATNSDQDRASLQQEVSQLLSEIERVANQTEFNGWPMLNGKTKPLVFQIGAQESQTVVVTLADARAATLLAQPQPADPNNLVSVKNPLITGMTIKAPTTQLAGSKLFSSTAAKMINTLANANTQGPSPWTIDSSTVSKNMMNAIDDQNTTTVAPLIDAAVVSTTGVVNALETNLMDRDTAVNKAVNIATTALVPATLATSPDAKIQTAASKGIAAGKSLTDLTTDIQAANPKLSSANAQTIAQAAVDASNFGSAVAINAVGVNVDLQTLVANVANTTSAIVTGLGFAPVVAGLTTAINNGIDSNLDVTAMAAAITGADPRITGNNAKGLAAAVLAARGRNNDGVTKLTAGGNQKSAVIAAWVAETVVKPADSTINSDQARVIAAATYDAIRTTYTDSDTVPAQYTALAGATNGAIFNASAPATVIDNAVTNGTTVKDVPVGNLILVIQAFRGAVNENKDIESIAQAAVAADQSKQLTVSEAKIIAAAGLSAAKPSGTVASAQASAKQMALVLGARDSAVRAASQPKGGEYITVPSWMVDTSQQTKFPPSPLIDITGATIPTDPTLPFNPPTTNASNPPLSGQDAAARMISIVKQAIDRVSSTRAELGAIQNRFTSNINNLSNVVENVSAARSRILDTDIAAETANMTKLTIMQQAGTAVLAQCNQQPQLALQLLR